MHDTPRGVSEYVEPVLARRTLDTSRIDGRVEHLVAEMIWIARCTICLAEHEVTGFGVTPALG
jgi:hypothetical protein